nr:UreC [Cereibacter sphaeroides]
MPASISRSTYASMFGPTTGDRLRLGDTELVIEVERDLTTYGEEVKFGGGKVIRDGMGQSQRTRAEGAMDTVITNALIVDWTGIYKADVGLRDGRIAKIGKAGNPDTQPGVDIVIGPGTEIIAGEGRILTAGGMDAHIHFICPQQIEDSLHSGITTMLGGGTGPAHGTLATTLHAGALAHRADAAGGRRLPDQPRLRGQGQCQPARRARGAGPRGRLVPEAARGLGHHACGHRLLPVGRRPHGCAGDDPHRHAERERLRREHAGRHRRAHDPCVPHRGCGRRPCARHHQGGGRRERHPVLDQSHHALHRQYGGGASRHADGLPPSRPLDPRGCGLRREPHPARKTIAAEDILHDMGAFSVISSDSQAMGRVGEVITRTWQTAHKMKVQRGRLAEETGANDNQRVRRYIAKYTINPAIAHGLSRHIGSVEEGKRADLVLWQPAFFGAKPDLVLLGGMIVCAQMGDPNGSIPAQPYYSRPMFGAFGGALHASAVTFVSQAAEEDGVGERLRLQKGTLAVQGTRDIGKADMKLNAHRPSIEVNPETYEVRADGELLTCQPLAELPLAQRYFLY